MKIVTWPKIFCMIGLHKALAQIEDCYLFGFLFLSVWRVQQGLLAPGEPQDSSALSHGRKAVYVWVPRLHQGLQQRLGQSQASEQNALQRCKSILYFHT